MCLIWFDVFLKTMSSSSSHMRIRGWKGLLLVVVVVAFPFLVSQPLSRRKKGRATLEPYFCCSSLIHTRSAVAAASNDDEDSSSEGCSYAADDEVVAAHNRPDRVCVSSCPTQLSYTDLTTLYIFYRQSKLGSSSSIQEGKSRGLASSEKTPKSPKNWSITQVSPKRD